MYKLLHSMCICTNTFTFIGQMNAAKRIVSSFKRCLTEQWKHLHCHVYESTVLLKVRFFLNKCEIA